MRPINLLPPESFEKEKQRRLIFRLVVLAAGFLILLVLITILWSGRIGSAEDRLDQQQALNEELERQLGGLQTSEQLVSSYNENAALIMASLANDVSWGRVLNDLGRMIPDRVWLGRFTGALESLVGEETVAIGSIEVSGNGFDYPDVSAWLRALDSDRFPSVGGAWVTSITEREIGQAVVVGFESQTSLTEAAQSDRGAERVPEVGT